MKKLGFMTLLLLSGAALAASPKDTLVIQESSDIPTLDPGIAYDTSSGSFIENIYEGLWTYKGASLTALATAIHVRLHVVLAEAIRRRERLLDARDEGGPREIIAECPTIDVPLARAGLDVDAADSLLAAADRMRDLRVEHVLLRLGFREGQRPGALRGVRVLGAWIDA